MSHYDSIGDLIVYVISNTKNVLNKDRNAQSHAVTGKLITAGWYHEATNSYNQEVDYFPITASLEVSYSSDTTPICQRVHFQKCDLCGRTILLIL